MEVEVVDPVANYADLMESLFDFGATSALFANGFTIRFDAIHAVTGPYAKAITRRTFRHARWPCGQCGAITLTSTADTRPQSDLGEELDGCAV